MGVHVLKKKKVEGEGKEEGEKEGEGRKRRGRRRKRLDTWNGLATEQQQNVSHKEIKHTPKWKMQNYRILEENIKKSRFLKVLSYDPAIIFLGISELILKFMPIQNFYNNVSDNFPQKSDSK